MTQKILHLAKTSFTLLAIATACAAAPAAPKKPASVVQAPAGSVQLRQQAIHIAYNEGDFDKVTAEIQNFTQANKTYTRADSIFIAKHLAVVYTANPGTREKGKYYMYRLLEMVPSAELVDMFVSDEIDRIFDKVRKEFLARQQSFGVDSSQMSIPSKPSGKGEPVVAAAQPAAGSNAEPVAPTSPASTPFYKKKGFWMMTGAGVAATAAVVTYVHSQEEAEGKSIKIGGTTDQ